MNFNEFDIYYGKQTRKNINITGLQLDLLSLKLSSHSDKSQRIIDKNGWNKIVGG